MPCKWVSPSIAATLGNLEGIRLPGFFDWKGWYIWVPFLDPEDIKILNLGPSGTLVEGQGSPELVSDYEAQRAIRPRCIGTVRARTQCKSIATLPIKLVSLNTQIPDFITQVSDSQIQHCFSTTSVATQNNTSPTTVVTRSNMTCTNTPVQSAAAQMNQSRP